MPGIEELTIGYDWESWLLKPDMSPADKREIRALCCEVRWDAPDTGPSDEDAYMEMRSGICRSFPELVERTEGFARKVHEWCAEHGRVWLPMGLHPLHASPGGETGLHCHVGSVYDFPRMLRARNALTPYLPALIALSANSPVKLGEALSPKTLRLARNEEGASWPDSPRDPETARNDLWGDLSILRSNKPTYEVRVSDGASFPRFVCEYACLVAALVDWAMAHLGDLQATFSGAELRTHMTNRYQAMWYGLQATFDWDGRRRPVAEVLREMIALASESMGRLNLDEGDLELIPLMLEKRRNQADTQRDVLSRCGGDVWTWASVYAHLIARPESFAEYLRRAPAAEPVEPRPLEGFLSEYLGPEARLADLEWAFCAPCADVEAMLARMERRGDIAITRSPRDGTRICRTNGLGPTARDGDAGAPRACPEVRAGPVR